MMHLVLPPDYSEKRISAIITLAERAAAKRDSFEIRDYVKRRAAAKKGLCRGG